MTDNNTDVPVPTVQVRKLPITDAHLPDHMDEARAVTFIEFPYNGNRILLLGGHVQNSQISMEKGVYQRIEPLAQVSLHDSMNTAEAAQYLIDNHQSLTESIMGVTFDE